MTDRTAKVNRGPDGEALGVAVYFNADQLAKLGIDPDEAERVQFQVEDGRLRAEGEQ